MKKKKVQEMTITDQPTTTGIVPEFDLADRLRKSLRVAGVGVSEMADYLGVSRTSLSAYLGGRVEPSHPVIILWAQHTGVDQQWLMTGKRPRKETR